MSSSVIVSDGPSPEFVVLANDIFTHGEGAVFHVSCMQDISSVDLHIFNIELCLAINDNLASIVFLATLLRIKIGPCEDQPNLITVRYRIGIMDKFFSVVDCLNLGSNVLSAKLGTVVCLRHCGHHLQNAKVMHIELDKI